MHGSASWCKVLLELLFLLWSSSVFLEYDDHFIISIFSVNCTLATHHFHNLVTADSVLRLVQSCVSGQTSRSRFVLIFLLQDCHWCRVRHNLLLTPLCCQALPNELLLRIHIWVGSRSSIRPLLFISLTMSGCLWVFVRINWFFSDVNWRLFKLLARARIWTFLSSVYFSHILVAVYLGIFSRASWRSGVGGGPLWGLLIW